MGSFQLKKGHIMKTKVNLWGIGVCAAAAIVLYFLVCPASAQMLSASKFSLDLTKPDEFNKKAIWGPMSTRISFTKEGLTNKAPENVTSDFWFEVTEPIAVGWSWRTVPFVNIETEIVTGWLYARYSADALHWSSWQYIQADRPKDQNQPERKYSGLLSIPKRQQQRYQELLMKYQSLDVPWTSDEEAAVEWIVKNDPNFFNNPAPFIGYVQFLFEGRLKGGQCIKNINFNILYSAGGAATIPKDGNRNTSFIRSEIPWRYKAPSINQQSTERFRVQVIQSAIDAYYLNCRVYPRTLDELLACPAGLESKWAGPYIKESGLYDSQGRR
jgi:hypothetical protein